MHSGSSPSTSVDKTGPQVEDDVHVRVSHNATMHIIRGRSGQRLMQAIRDAGLPIAADCGGACTCATCHVYVGENCSELLSPPGANEAALLEVVDERTSQSRLSCQIELTPSLSGLEVALAPGSY
jgi:ferredoxin, 2Fe-2S